MDDLKYTSTGSMSGLAARKEPAYYVTAGTRALGIVAKKRSGWFALPTGVIGPDCAQGPFKTRTLAAESLLVKA